MKRSTKYVGLDLHQATTVSTVRNDSGSVIARAVLPTTATALVEFVRGMRGSIRVAMEEGTQVQWLHDVLAPVVQRVVVCDRRGKSQQGNKGDQADADELSDLLRCGRLRVVYHASVERVRLKELARTYANLVEDGTRVMQRVKALFRARRSDSRAPESTGLIATSKTRRRSVSTKCAIDNRSHRTPKFTYERVE
jgi:hypothetical protein